MKYPIDNMKKIEIGDLFEIDTPRGKGYFQYAYSDKLNGALIRVLPGLYVDQIQDIMSLVVTKESYFIYFPLKAAYKRGIVKMVGNYELPIDLKLPKQMRSKNVDKNGNLICWFIIDCDTWQRINVQKLTEEQKKLSPWGIWNDTLLIERMVEGWTPEKWI